MKHLLHRRSASLPDIIPEKQIEGVKGQTLLPLAAVQQSIPHAQIKRRQVFIRFHGVPFNCDWLHRFTSEPFAAADTVMLLFFVLFLFLLFVCLFVVVFLTRNDI